VAPAPGRAPGRVNRSAWSLSHMLALNVRASVPCAPKAARRTAPATEPALTRFYPGRERRRSALASRGMLSVASADPRVRGGGLARVKVGWAALKVPQFTAPTDAALCVYLQ